MHQQQQPQLQQRLEEAAKAERKAATIVQDAISALGTPATIMSAVAAAAGGDGAGLGLGLGALQLSAFGDATEDEMRNLIRVCRICSRSVFGF